MGADGPAVYQRAHVLGPRLLHTCTSTAASAQKSALLLRPRQSHRAMSLHLSTLHPPSVRLLRFPPTAILCSARRAKKGPQTETPTAAPAKGPAPKGRDTDSTLAAGGRTHRTTGL
ncbi:uncharacterized protein TrAFT101_008237 [Trichoderma asperellum]|uniref:uncharacterized protein n=1 Tax=Trichoderma asperellum TaxID=101201 RepID=UPI00331C6E91|nr:hypothetical protein TrAFT101_008237 [Trichoderma asperellum]